VESTVTTHRLVVAEAQHGGCWVGPARRVGCVDGMGLTLHPVCGLIIAAVPASARIWQLRKALKKNARHDPPPPT